jgi:hypothetical protein
MNIWLWAVYLRYMESKKESEEGDGNMDCTMVAHEAAANVLECKLDVTVGSSSKDTLWGSLPNDILDRALLFLPFPELFRVRTVCKRWDSLVLCNNFQHLFLDCPVTWGQFYTQRFGRKSGAPTSVLWATYDLSLRKWVCMPEIIFPAAVKALSWNLVVANGGLLCFAALEACRMLVCNPMTKAWKELPQMKRMNSIAPALTHMVVNNVTNSYTILFAGNKNHKESEDGYRSTEVYNSISSSWEPAGLVPADLALKSGAFCNGLFYCMTRNLTTGLYKVIILNLQQRVWIDKNVLLPAGFENYPYVVACGGHIYAVAGSLEGGQLPMTSIGIFELEPTSLEWMEIAYYQNRDFLCSTGAIYGCGGDGTKIFVVTYAYDMLVAVYDISQGHWENPIKGSFYDLKDIYETRFSFQPDIAMSP